jgi:hypothetical protein
MAGVLTQLGELGIAELSRVPDPGELQLNGISRQAFSQELRCRAAPFAHLCSAYAWRKENRSLY